MPQARMPATRVQIYLSSRNAWAILIVAAGVSVTFVADWGNLSRSVPISCVGRQPYPEPDMRRKEFRVSLGCLVSYRIVKERVAG